MRRNMQGPQQMTRIPPYRPGHWVKVKDFGDPELGCDLSGRVLRVKSITASLTRPEQKLVVWRIHFDDGRCLEWHLIERFATEGEIEVASYRRRAA